MTQSLVDPMRASVNSGHVSARHSKHQNNFPCRWRITAQPHGMIKCVYAIIGKGGGKGGKEREAEKRRIRNGEKKRESSREIVIVIIYI